MYYRAGGRLKKLTDDEGAMLMVTESICNEKWICMYLLNMLNVKMFGVKV